jgi:hypothetical protein
MRYRNFIAKFHSFIQCAKFHIVCSFILFSWDTSIGGLIFSDQFIQIASYLSSKNVFGLGENAHRTLRHDLQYRTWPIFARDNPVDQVMFIFINININDLDDIDECNDLE